MKCEDYYQTTCQHLVKGGEKNKEQEEAEGEEEGGRRKEEGGRRNNEKHVSSGQWSRSALYTE